MSEKKEGRGHDAGGNGGRGSRKPGHKDASGHRERRFDGPDDVPMLRHGPDNNFHKFVIRAAMKEYGDLGRLIETGKYYEPPEINQADYDLADDPHGVNLQDYKEARKMRQRQVAEMKNHRANLYAMIEQKLSLASLDEVKRHEKYATFHTDKDPKGLWEAVEETHRVASVSKVASIVKQTARAAYNSLRQGAYESIIAYKERFDAVLQAYINQGNPAMEETDIALDFLRSLDDARYAEFKVEIINDISKGAMEQTKTLNSVYVMANSRLVARKVSGQTFNASFATSADTITDTKAINKARQFKRENKHRLSSNTQGRKEKDQGRTKNVEGKRDMSKIECYQCGQLGHMARDCTLNPETAESKAVNATRSVFASPGTEYKPHEVLLDNCTDVSVMHPRFLTHLTPCDGNGFAGLGGQRTTITNTGHPRDFFECLSCTCCTAKILCQADIEDMYKVTMIQGEKYIVHLPQRDLEFVRRGRVYVADMSDWVVKRGHHVAATTSANEELYTTKEIIKARQAKEFIHNSGYPSEKEAAHLVNDGNITRVPITTRDIHRAFDVYGKPAAAVRGKATKQKTAREEVDDILKERRTDQVLYTDVMHVRKQPYLITLSEPLQLLIVARLERETTEQLGLAMQQHLNILRARGFNPVRVHIEPQPALTALTGHFPGVEVDTSGAGDHLDKIDIRIRRVKETIRSVHASLPWKLPDERVRDLVAYAVTRINMRRTSASTTNVAPRTAFTGRKPNYKKEFSLAFGDYCECYSGRVISNDAEQDRTEPCIALYPTANANGSWIFLNMKTNKYVRRSSWTKMVTTDLVINRMNELAGANDQALLFADEQLPEGRDDRPMEPQARLQTHTVDPNIETPVHIEEDEITYAMDDKCTV